MDNKKKPPIKISDLEESVKSEAKPGELTYLSGGKGGGAGGGGKGMFGGKVNWGQVLLPVVVSLMLSLLIIIQYAPSKLVYNEGVNRLAVLADNFVVEQQKLGSIAERVENIVGTMPKYAEKSELLALQTSFKALQGTVEDTTKVTALEGKVVGLEGKVLALSGELALYKTQEKDIGSNVGLTRSGSSLSISAESSKAGTYVLEVSLLYGLPVVLDGSSYGEAVQYFYNHLASPNRQYRCTLDYYLGIWRLVEVEFTSGRFKLGSNKASSFTVEFQGLAFYGTGNEVSVKLAPSTGEGVLGGSI